jgi:pseudaminic acid biosynthesis-associated methylase
MPETSQLSHWQGEFGDEYTERNVYDWHQRAPSFREMIDGLNVQRVLEAGCNRGLNLLAFSDILGPEAQVVGIEPNLHACEAARVASPKISALQATGFEIPFRDGWFDLAFTCGVLIHIAGDDLPRMLAEIHRVSRRYILAVEYFAETDTEIPYRGHSGLLWKRNFLAHYQQQFPELTVVRQGYVGPEKGFDRCHWWLMEKSRA